MITKNSPCFSVSWQFMEYAKRVKLDRLSASSTQWTETRRAFYGAWGQMLFMLRDELSDLDDDDGIEVLEQMKTEVTRFWQTENNRQN